MQVGIDALSFYTPRYFLDLRQLAKARLVDPQKYLIGLGQEYMAVPPPDEDIVSMAATAALQALRNIDRNSIAMLLLATESGIDHSKAAGIWVHHLLDLPKNCRIIELKQACYSGVGALQLALPYLYRHPDKKILILASDIARYGLKTPGEPTQGAGACALVLSTAPRLLIIEPEYGCYADHVMDFWRPNYFQEAIVDGKYSTKIYLTALDACWKEYQNRSARLFSDHARFCYHLPFTRLAEKAHERLAKASSANPLTPKELSKHLADSLTYGRKMGNSYTAALFISLASLLDHATENLAHARIGCFSYGSGCVAEYFSAIVQAGYRQHLHIALHAALFNQRRELSMAEYEQFYHFTLPQDGQKYAIDYHLTGLFRLKGIFQHERLYEKCSP
jgi:hydroxymethylglutaryl-CoA synthase